MSIILINKINNNTQDWYVIFWVWGPVYYFIQCDLFDKTRCCYWIDFNLFISFSNWCLLWKNPVNHRILKARNDITANKWNNKWNILHWIKDQILSHSILSHSICFNVIGKCLMCGFFLISFGLFLSVNFWLFGFLTIWICMIVRWCV